MGKTLLAAVKCRIDIFYMLQLAKKSSNPIVAPCSTPKGVLDYMRIW